MTYEEQLEELMIQFSETDDEDEKVYLSHVISIWEEVGDIIVQQEILNNYTGWDYVN